MTIPPLSTANSARHAAARHRGAALVAVAGGESTVRDVILAACTEDGKPLTRVTLRQLLMAQPGWGPDRAAKALEHTLTTLGNPEVNQRKLTIAWLLDKRAGGRRFMAFCDALYPRASAPWPGFPFAARPNTTADTRAS
jgi:hypothetical protein